MSGGGSGGKGPSEGDTSFDQPLKTIAAGIGSTPSMTPGGSIPADPSSALPGSSGMPGYSSSEGISAPPSPTWSVGYSGSADPSSSAISGAGQPSDPGNYSPFASISNPTGVPLGTTGVFETGAEPFQSWGTAPGGGADPSGATSAPLGSSGVVAPTPPTGAAPPTGADPTSRVYDPLEQYRGGTPGAAQPAAAASPIPKRDEGGFSLEKLFSGLTSSATNNPLAFLGAAGMAYNAYKTNQAMKDIPSISSLTPQLQEQASKLNASGQQLASYLTSGTLPEGLKTSLEQATKAAKTTIISNFASRGLPTDPTKNSVLAQELAAVDAQAVISTAQIGQQLMETGMRQTGMASDLYKTLVNIDMSMQAQIQKSIANFAAAMNKK